MVKSNLLFTPNLNQAILIIRATTGIAFAGAMYALFVLVLPLSALGAAMRKIIFKREDYLPYNLFS